MLLLMAGLFVLLPMNGRAAEYTVGPVPAWVVSVAAGVSSADQISKGSAGVAYLLTDTQTLVGEQHRVRYHRLVSTALNANGVEAVANIEIPFDPSYQTLVLHSINIVRAGHVIPKLATAKIRVIEREAELEARIYDGTKTVNVFLEDVRAGDTIDYAYSVTGRNPVFKGNDFGAFYLQFGIPVARVHERLLLPLNKPVVFSARNSTMNAAVRVHDGLRDYVWDVIDPPELTVDQGAPDWYAPFAEVRWSEFADWAAVARWAQPLYRVPTVLSPELQAKADLIAKTENTAAGRMLAVLRLVQSEVRYLGVEIGQNSHEPNAPEVVFARRFGDCKDKTLLALALLDRLGIEAHAALVNTRLKRGLADALPSPGVFDHVLVQAQVDGKTWWIDPTRYTQRADLEHLSQPDFGLALIVGPSTRGLTAMTRAGPGSSSRSLLTEFDASAGFDKPVRYTLETTTDGEAAESLRAILSSTNLVDMQKSYLNFYANSYPHITAETPFNVRDDESINRIRTRETFLITNMSTPSDDGRRRGAVIKLPDIQRVLRDPTVTIRKSPLQLGYPLDVSQRTEVLLSGPWPIKPDSVTINDPAFRFEQSERLEGSRLIITDHFQNLTDEVATKDMARYLGNLAQAREHAGYFLSWAATPATTAAPNKAKATALDRMNWPVALLVLGMFGLWIWLAVVIYRYDTLPENVQDTRWVGIGGWLLLLALGLLLRPFLFGLSFVHVFNATSIDHWAALTTFGNSSYNALFAPLLLFELAVDSAQLVFSLLLLTLFFKRRSNFPRVALMLLLSAPMLQIADLALSRFIPTIKTTEKDITDLVRSVLSTAIWSAYLLQSRRVKSTFVRTYQVVATPQPQPSPPPPPPPPTPPPLPQIFASTARFQRVAAEVTFDSKRVE